MLLRTELLAAILLLCTGCTSCIEYVGDVDSVGYSAAMCSAENPGPENKCRAWVF